jgi:hypothetical protein
MKRFFSKKGPSVLSGGLFLFAAFFVPVRSFAGLTEAKEAYSRGIVQERARHYEVALAEYQACVAEEPGYYWAYKQIGNCDYYLGRKQEALTAYQRYLDQNPADSAVRNFADKLKLELDAAGKLTANQPVATPTPVEHHWSIQAGGGYGAYSMTEFNSWAASEFGGMSLPGGGEVMLTGERYFTRNVSAGIYARYSWANFDYLSNSNYGPTTAHYSFPIWYFGPQVAYTFPQVMARTDFKLGLNAGYAMLSGSYGLLTFSNFSNYDRVDYSGSGWGLSAYLTQTWDLNSFVSIDTILNYRVLRIGSVSFTRESGSTAFSTWADWPTNSDGSARPLDYSGLFLGVGLGLSL